MDFHLYWISFIVLLAAYFKQGIFQNITLTTSKEVVLENSSVALTCSNSSGGILVSSSWNAPFYGSKLAQCVQINKTCKATLFLSNNTLFDCICNDDGSNTIILKYVERHQHDSNWTCRRAFEISNTVFVNVSVPVTHAVLTQSKKEPMYENGNVTLTCASSYSLPSAKIRWYRSYSTFILELTDSKDVGIKHQTDTRKDNVIRVTEILSYKVNRSVNGWSVYCTVTNWENNVIESGKIELLIIFPPVWPPVIDNISHGSSFKVIENEKVNLSCSVNGGNPLPKLEWHCGNITGITWNERNNHETVTSYISWIAKRTNGKECTCKMGHDLLNESITINIDVLYPPGIPNIKLQHLSEKKYMAADAKLLENKNYSLLCIADANPPSKYIWSGPEKAGISNNSSIDFHDMDRTQNGTYTCQARTSMFPTYGGSRTMENNNSVKVDILYKPTLAVINNQDAVESSALNVSCEVISSNPSDIDFTWTRDTGDFEKNSKDLVLQNISRHDAMNYTCTVKNYMKPTIGEDEEGYASETFYVNVYYKASVTKFVVNGYENDVHVVTNESNFITFTCEIDSNPNPIVKIITPNGTEIIPAGTHVFQYSHFMSSCVDFGTYTCFGSNDYNYGQPGIAKLPVFVKCTPMAYHHFETDLRSKLYVPVTVQFKAVAYPNPNFIWETWAKSSWKKITNDSMFSVSSLNLQSNLTVFNFTTTTSSLYRLIVENEIGTFIQNYTLKPLDRPETPSEFSHVDESLTDMSVTLTWKPGFNGGVSQTFMITYMDNKDKSWETVTLQDTEQSVMNLTIHGLSSNTNYVIHLSAVNSEGSTGNVTLQIKTKDMTRKAVTETGSIVAPIVGSISGATVVLIVVLVGILLYRNRSSPEKGSGSSDCVYQNVQFAENSQKKKINAKTPSKKETSLQTLQELDDAPPIYREPTEYYNSPDKIEQHERVQVSELLPFVLGSSEESFAIEYQKLPTELQKPCVFARKPENIAMNRYNGIYPYDHSRVKIPGKPEFFINACYIDGYAKKNEYIASLGPTEVATDDFKTFWMMVWNEQSDIIVMLTNLYEPSGMKCQRYWPELGTTKLYGDIQVTSDKEDAFAEYTTRSFIVSNPKERRSVTHLHYTAWPDKKVPEDVTTLIEFRERIKITPSTKEGPLIVHCSAGIGWTGTLIALDRLIQEGQCISSVDVFKCVNSMREQRVKMVQTLEQYIYIYKALVNSLYFDNEMIPIESFQEYVDQTNNNIYSRQFQQLKDSVEKCCEEESDARARNEMLVDKNRKGADIPGNQNRVSLYQNRNTEMSDYINAVYVSSFKKKDHFILAQSPLPGTVSDFVGMMYKKNCCCIVTMEDLTKPVMNVGEYLPTDGQAKIFGDIQLSCFTLESKPQYIVKEIRLQNCGQIQSREKVAYHFQYNKWVQGNDVPTDAEGFVQFIKTVEEYSDQLGDEESHVLVHCPKANERSALYSIVAILTEKIRYERQVSVLNTVRHLRTRRKTAITSMEQLKFCYKAVKVYIELFDS